MSAVLSGPAARHQRRGSFYLATAIACTAIAVLGFAHTYFLKPFVDSPALPALVHVHGIVFTGWLLLLVAQTGLIRAGRSDLHRRLGVVGLILAGCMVLLGFLTAVGGARRGVTAGGLDPLAFMAVPLAAIALFLLFVGLAGLKRGRPESHKRLMLLGTFSILTPALARLWFVHQRPAIAFALTVLLVLVAVGHDLATRRSIHPVYVWGGLLILASGPLRIAIGRTEAWHTLASALAG